MSTVKSPLHLLAALVSGQFDPRTLSPVEAQAVVPLALQHGLGPMLQWTVKRAGMDIAAPVWSLLIRPIRAAAVRYMQLKSAQATVQAALTAAGIPAIWLKGFALAHMVYPHPALRPMGDLDVLVPFARREAALAVAESIGYHVSVPPLLNSLRDMEHHYHLSGNPSDAVTLELHYHLLTLSEKLLPLSQLEWFWRQTRHHTSRGGEFTSLTPEAHLLHLCAHNILHHGSQALLLRRYLDLHLLVTHSPILDWQLVVDQAVAFRWTYTVGQALAITQEYWGTRLPNDLMAELERRRPAQEDISHITRRLSPTSTVRNYVNSLATLRWSSAMRWIAGAIFPSPAYMRWRYRVAATWKLPFYYLYRWLKVDKWQAR